MGHEGDVQQLIAAAAAAVAAAFARPTAGRVEGARFSILLEDMADESNFVQVADRIGQAFAAPLMLNRRRLRECQPRDRQRLPDDSVDDMLRTPTSRCVRRGGGDAARANSSTRVSTSRRWRIPDSRMTCAVP